VTALSRTRGVFEYRTGSSPITEHVFGIRARVLRPFGFVVNYVSIIAKFWNKCQPLFSKFDFVDSDLNPWDRRFQDFCTCVPFLLYGYKYARISEGTWISYHRYPMIIFALISTEIRVSPQGKFEICLSYGCPCSKISHGYLLAWIDIQSMIVFLYAEIWISLHGYLCNNVRKEYMCLRKCTCHCSKNVSKLFDVCVVRDNVRWLCCSEQTQVVCTGQCLLGVAIYTWPWLRLQTSSDLLSFSRSEQPKRLLNHLCLQKSSFSHRRPPSTTSRPSTVTSHSSFNIDELTDRQGFWPISVSLKQIQTSS